MRYKFSTKLWTHGGFIITLPFSAISGNFWQCLVSTSFWGSLQEYNFKKLKSTSQSSTKLWTNRGSFWPLLAISGKSWYLQLLGGHLQNIIKNWSLYLNPVQGYGPTEVDFGHFWPFLAIFCNVWYFSVIFANFWKFLVPSTFRGSH